MSIRAIFVSSVMLAVFCLETSFCQEKSGAQNAVHQPPGASTVQEFPVTMRQNVVAGKTPVGAKVEARLAIATLIAGKVAPEGAIFSGVVVESAAKSDSLPSRLCVRFDSVQWKKESAPIQAYLTSWYYPVRMGLNEDVSGGPPVDLHGDVGMQRGTASRPVAPSSTPYPAPGSSKQGSDVPSAPSSNLSDHRVELKDVEPERASDGTMSVISSRINIKLDKSTTYVLATGELKSSK